jgi:hypothetical protein
VTGTDNIEFARVQKEYLKTRDKKHLTEMYLLCAKVAANCIKKHCRQHGLFLEIDELAHDTATYVINRYLENTDFKLDPMVGYVLLCSKGIIYADKTWNKRKVSLEDWMLGQDSYD